jgi:hypothetical protein
MPSPRRGEAGFKDRYREQFFDPAFDDVHEEIERITRMGWDHPRHLARRLIAVVVPPVTRHSTASDEAVQ